MQILRMFKLVAHNKKLLCLILSLAVFVTVVDMLSPFLLKYMIDGLTSIYNNKPVETNRFVQLFTGSSSSIIIIFVMYLTYLFLELVRLFGSSFWQFLGYWWCYEDSSLRFDLIKKLVTLDITYFEDDNPGKIHSRLGKGVSNIIRGSGESYAFIIPQIPAFLVTLYIFICYAGWQATLITIAPVILIFLVAWRGFIALKPWLEQERELDEKFEKLIYQVISGIRPVISFKMQDYIFKRMKNIQDDLLNNSCNLEWTALWFSRSKELIMRLVHSGLLGFCIYSIFYSDMTVGTAVMLITYCNRIYMPLWHICHIIFDRILRQSYRIKRVFETFDEEPKIVEVENPVILYDVEGAISFERVGFRYSNQKSRERFLELKEECKQLRLKGECRIKQVKERLKIRESLQKGVLNGFNLKIDPGELVAIVGPTGAGKSTLVKLLQRFYDPQKGIIRLDNLNIKDIQFDQFRNLIAEVTQDTNLFDDTIANNISCGQNVSIELIKWAAKQACIDGYINSLPLSYDSIVGDRGIKLSGGQKQRVVMARAFLKVKLFDCKILILDEPTASLDSKTEEVVQRALARLVKGRTTIMIAHRLSTIKAADKIVYLEKGKVRECGTHDELISQGREYAKLWRIQTEGFSTALNEEFSLAT